jgi:hypothetical protein
MACMKFIAKCFKINGEFLSKHFMLAPFLHMV